MVANLQQEYDLDDALAFLLTDNEDEEDRAQTKQGRGTGKTAGKDSDALAAGAWCNSQMRTSIYFGANPGQKTQQF